MTQSSSSLFVFDFNISETQPMLGVDVGKKYMKAAEF